jgi:hypothetical protein
MSLLAQLEPRDPDANRRAATRRTLRLKTRGATYSETAVEVVIYDLSLTGLLIETSGDLSAGERFDVDVPEAGPMQAKVVWNSGHFYGCKFKKPIPPAALSSAILLSPSYSHGVSTSDQVSRALLDLQALRSNLRQMTEQLARVIDHLFNVQKW